MFEDKEESHESFGMMSFTRIQVGGGGEVLHGSDLKHNTIIAMRLHHGSKKHGLSRDWYHANDRIAEVYMSQNQFSELITSMNMGDGIPVTLKHTESGGELESPKFDSIVDRHKEDFKETTKEVVQDVSSLLETMKEALKSGTVKKADREAMISMAEKVVRDIGANMPYMEESFEKAIDNVVTDAKGTIEAFHQHRVTTAGLKALGAEGTEPPKLIEKE